LAAEAPLRGADSAAEQFCSQIAPLLSKFPFNPQSPIDATSNEVAKVFAPGTGSFATYNSSLKTLVVQEGSNFHSVADSGPPVSRAFLKFLNDAATISSTLFPTGGNEPSLYFTLTEIKSPGVPDAVLNIDEQQITGAGQKVSFHWVSKPDSKYSISSNGNSSAPKAGPWSVFHFGFNATHLTPNRLKFSLQMNNETNGVVQFDLSGPGAPLLNPVFMNRFRCVPRMFR
jgi:type VI secretion system protein ImpL